MGFRLANVDGRAVLVRGNHYTDIATHSSGVLGADPMEVLARPDLLAEISAALDEASVTGSARRRRARAARAAPAEVFGVGLNYLAHAAEGGREAPDSPFVFTKFPSCLVGPTADVEIRSDGCDYEGELVVVIGRGGRDITIADAWRPCRRRHGRSGHLRPSGPVRCDTAALRSRQVVRHVRPDRTGRRLDRRTPDRDALRIVCAINGEVRQDGNTADLIFDVPTLVSFLSSITTLVTGDIIFTGTPEGVGAAQGKFLADGDVITTTIDGIGTMTNRVVRISDARPIGA
jgi:2,4-didehydro-3-deoxy-L-rhamnonate hydrolase